MAQPVPTPDTNLTFRIDCPALHGEKYVTCKLSELPAQLWQAMGHVGDLMIGQAPMIVEIRRID